MPDEYETKEMYCDIKDIGKDTDRIIEKLGEDERHMDNGMSLAALLNSKDDNNAMMMWNNPWIYFVWMAMFANRNGGLFGGNGDASPAALTQMLNSLGEIKAALTGNGMQATQVASEIGRNGQAIGFNKDYVISAVNQNREAICNCCSQLQQAICNNGHETAMQLCNIGNMIQQGDCNIITAIKDCCCQTNLNIERLENSFGRQLDRSTCDIEKALYTLGNGMNSQFTNLQFANQVQSSNILAAINADGEKTRDLLHQQKYEQVVRERDLAFAQLSQNDQTTKLVGYMDARIAQLFGQPYCNNGNRWNDNCCCCNPNGSRGNPFFVTVTER